MWWVSAHFTKYSRVFDFRNEVGITNSLMARKGAEDKMQTMSHAVEGH